MVELDAHFIYVKYWLEEPGWSGMDLAKYYNCGHVKIYRFMERNNILRRNYKNAQLNKLACNWKAEISKKALEKVHKNPSFQKKQSELMKKQRRDPEFNKKNVEAINKPEVLKKKSQRMMKNKFNLGKHHSEATKKRMSEAKKGEKNPFYGKLHSEATKKKMSEDRKGEKNSNWKYMFTKEFLQEQYLILNKSLTEIAKENKCSISTISRNLINYNIPRRSGRPKGCVP